MHWRVVQHGIEFGWLFIILFAVLIILGIIYLASLISTGKERHVESPIHILKRRYAKGELTREEFERMKDEITQDVCKR